jgi:hypothetical protein
VKRARAILPLLVIAMGFAAPIAVADESREDRIVIAETAETFQVSMPVSRLVMTFPRGGFGAELLDEETDGPRYFSFTDSGRGAMMTGWFEPAVGYSGIEALWKGDVAAWKKAGLPEPKHVEFVRIGRWEAVTYDMKLPEGSNTHIRAQWTELGTWIDLHISVTTAASIESARETAQDILQSVQISATAEE